MNEGFLKVTGKGKKERIVPIGNNKELYKDIFSGIGLHQLM